jgi:hypothetical protein
VTTVANHHLTFTQALDCLRAEAGEAAFDEWKRLLDESREVYAGFPVHSCSVEGHPAARAFRAWLAPRISGRVLDVGCGPQPVPLYLEGLPLKQLVGVDDYHLFHWTPQRFKEAIQGLFLAEEVDHFRSNSFVSFRPEGETG